MKKLMMLVMLAACGCASSYSWSPKVPAKYRTVSVPVFRNESQLNELGSEMTRQVLREFQREGTFKIRRAGDSALEVQGVVKGVGVGSRAYDRRMHLRYSGYEMTATVEISVIDKLNGKVLVNNKVFKPETHFTASQDLTTSERDAAGRLGDDLSRRVVDMVLELGYEESDSNKENEK